MTDISDIIKIGLTQTQIDNLGKRGVAVLKNVEQNGCGGGEFNPLDTEDLKTTNMLRSICDNVGYVFFQKGSMIYVISKCSKVIV